MASHMKNKVHQWKFRSFENQLKETIFYISKWNTLLLNAKIQKHGHMSAYLEYLIERYSYRVYRGIREKMIISQEEKLILKCEVYESTLVELTELAEHAALSKGSMFLLLLAWDINPPKPCSKIAV